jgi:hypothetical protein
MLENLHLGIKYSGAGHEFNVNGPKIDNKVNRTQVNKVTY